MHGDAAWVALFRGSQQGSMFLRRSLHHAAAAAVASLSVVAWLTVELLWCVCCVVVCVPMCVLNCVLLLCPTVQCECRSVPVDSTGSDAPHTHTRGRHKNKDATATQTTKQCKSHRTQEGEITFLGVRFIGSLLLCVGEEFSAFAGCGSRAAQN